MCLIKVWPLIAICLVIYGCVSKLSELPAETAVLDIKDVKLKMAL